MRNERGAVLMVRRYLLKLWVLMAVFLAMGADVSVAGTSTREIIRPASPYDTAESCSIVAYDRLKRQLLEEVVSPISPPSPNTSSPISVKRLQARAAGAVKVELVEKSWKDKACRIKARVHDPPVDIFALLDAISKDEQKISVLEDAGRRASEIAGEIDALGRPNLTTTADDRTAARYHDAVRRLAAVDALESGILLLTRGRLKEATDAFTRSIHGDGRQADAFLQRAQLSGIAGQCAQAIGDYSRALNLLPANAGAYLGRGTAHACAGKYDEAVADYDRAIKLQPRQANAFFQRGEAHALSGRYQQAIGDYGSAIAIHPNETMAYLKRGMAYEHLGEHRQALADYSRAIESNLDVSAVFLRRAMVHRKLGNLRQAIGDYDRAAELNPGGAMIYVNRGAVYAALGEYEKAAKDYARALEVAPDLAEARQRRAEMIQKRNVRQDSDFSSAQTDQGKYGPKDIVAPATGLIDPQGGDEPHQPAARHVFSEKRGDEEVRSGLVRSYPKGDGHAEERPTGMGKRKFYTVQILSSPSREGAAGRARLLTTAGIEDIRVIRAGGWYALRAGIFEHRDAGLPSLQKIRRIYAGAMLIKTGGSVQVTALRGADRKTVVRKKPVVERLDPIAESRKDDQNRHPDADRDRSFMTRRDPLSQEEGIYPPIRPGTEDSRGLMPVDWSGDQNILTVSQSSRTLSAGLLSRTVYDVPEPPSVEEMAMVVAEKTQSEHPSGEETKRPPESPPTLEEGPSFKKNLEGQSAVQDQEKKVTGDKQSGPEHSQEAGESASNESEKPLPVAEAAPTAADQVERMINFRGVLHDLYGKPLPGAVIEMVDNPAVRTTSVQGGQFTLEGIPSGSDFMLKVEMEGYLPVYISSLSYPPDGETTPWFTLYPAAGATPAGQSKKPVTIEADSLSYERDTDTYHARGQVVITYTEDPGGVLTSDTAALNKETNKAEATGNVVMKSGKDVLYGDRVVLDIDTKTGSVYHGRMFMAKNHFYVSGDRIDKKGDATYFVENATATTCGGDSPDWRITGKEMDVTIDGYGSIKHGKFLAKNLPILYTPYLFFPVKTTRQSGFLFPHLSYSRDKLGFDTEIPFFWAISKNTDATFYQRYMSERGFKEGLEFRYSLSPESYGTFYADFLNDKKQISETNGSIKRDWSSGEKRWSVYLNHISTFSPGFYLRSDIAKVSDNWYFKDFSSHNYYLKNYSATQDERFRKVSFQADESLNTLDSTVRMVKNWEKYNLTGLVRYTDNFTIQSNDTTLQKYPEITLTGVKQPIFRSPVYYELSSIYAYNYRIEGQRGHIFDLKPDLSLPMKLGPLQLTPRAGWVGTFWNRDDDVIDTGKRSGNRQLFNVGGTLTTEVQRIFNVGGESVDKIRHSIKPEVTYTYIPYVEQGGIPDYAALMYEQNTLTYALTNTLAARLKDKQGKISYREFLRLKLAQRFDITESRRDVMPLDRENRPLSFLDMELDVNPFQYLSFAARNKFSVNSGEWKQTNYDLTLSDWRGDSVILGYRYTQDRNTAIPDLYSQGLYPSSFYIQDPNTQVLNSQNYIKEINLSLKAVITKNWDLTYFQRRNENIQQDTERTFGLNYRQQCWSVKLSYSDKMSYDTAGVEKPDRVFMVLLSFYGLGAVGN